MWFLKEKLFFSCNMCGECCREMDIPLTIYDIKRILDYDKNLPPEAFITVYPVEDSKLYSVLLYGETCYLYLSNKASDNSCIFLDSSNKCSIYNARPNPCRTWPFSKTSMEKIKVDEIAEKLVITHCDKKRFKDHSRINKEIDKGLEEVLEYRKFINLWNKKVVGKIDFQTLENFIAFSYEYL